MFTSCHTVSSGFSSRVGAHRFLHSGTMSGCSSPKRKQLPGEFSHSQACGGFLSNKVVVSGKCICHLVAGFFVFLQIWVFSVCFFNFLFLWVPSVSIAFWLWLIDSTYSPEEAWFLCDFEANCSFKAESSEMWSIRKRKPTLQATGMEFDEELGLRFCRQDGHTVHDLNSTRRRTAGIWKIKAASDCGYWADSSVA